MGGRNPKTTLDSDHRADGDTGGGPIDPATGLREWYDPEKPGTTWSDIFERWSLVEVDLHQLYGIDLGQPRLLKERTGHWLRARILGLLSEPRTRLFRALGDRPDQPPAARTADASFDDYE